MVNLRNHNWWITLFRLFTRPSSNGWMDFNSYPSEGTIGKRGGDKFEQRVDKKRPFTIFDGMGSSKSSLNIDKLNGIKRFGMENAVNCCQIAYKGWKMMLKENDVMTTQEACHYLRISRPTFLKYLYIGRIKGAKAGKGWKVLKSELDRFLKGEIPSNMMG